MVAPTLMAAGVGLVVGGYYRSFACTHDEFCRPNAFRAFAAGGVVLELAGISLLGLGIVRARQHGAGVKRLLALERTSATERLELRFGMVGVDVRGTF